MNILEALEASKQKKMTSNKNKLKPCSRCGSNNYEVRYAINKDGRDCYPYFCVICNARSPIVESKAVAKAMGLII